MAATPGVAILECDVKINGLINELSDQNGDQPLPPSTKKGSNALNEPQREQLFAKFGVDITAVEGVGIKTVQKCQTLRLMVGLVSRQSH